MPLINFHGKKYTYYGVAGMEDTAPASGVKRGAEPSQVRVATSAS
jgi:hypothetical protein